MTNPLCVRCHKPQAVHALANFADGPHIGVPLLVCPTATWQAPQEPNPQNVEKNPQRKDYGVYSPEVERDLSERYTTEAADVGVTAVEDLSAQATDAMNAGDYVRATHLWIRKVDTVYRELKQTESALAALRTALEKAKKHVQDLQQWRADVTVALQRPGGCHYADVAQHVRSAVNELATLRTALARLVWRWKNGHSIGSISDACADDLDRLLKEK